MSCIVKFAVAFMGRRLVPLSVAFTTETVELMSGIGMVTLSAVGSPVSFRASSLIVWTKSAALSLFV